jgi:hypothetical protein
MCDDKSQESIGLRWRVISAIKGPNIWGTEQTKKHQPKAGTPSAQELDLNNLPRG